MKRKKIEFHRSSNGKEDRKYGEQYIEYFYYPQNPIINGDILIEEVPYNLKEYIEIINSEMVLCNFLNLGQKLYDKYFHHDIYNLNYLFDRKMDNGLYASNFFEFIEFEIWKHKGIETVALDWIKSNPYYGEFEKDNINERLYPIPINFNTFVILSVTSYMIYRLYKISYNKTILNESTNELCLLSVFSDIIKKNANSKKVYLDKLKNLKPNEINNNCKLILRQLFNFNPTTISSVILDDGNYIKIYKSLLSMTIESLYSTIYLNSKTIKMCKDCGNYYSGHGNSSLCKPCRDWRDNHKHIKNDRN